MSDRHKHRRGERQIHKQTRRVEGGAFRGTQETWKRDRRIFHLTSH